jgi:Rod binding domain-containing protein
MTAGATQPATPDPKLVRAAHEFEAQMMKELLRPMAGGDALTGDEDGSGMELGSGSGADGALSDFASEALGQALSERGGFGIADRIVRELTTFHTLHVSSEATRKGTGSGQENTVLKNYK